MKRLIIRILFFLVILFLLFWGWGYIHKGKLVITTNNPENIITLTSARATSGTKNSLPIRQVQGHLSVTLSVGKYTLSVSGKVLSLNQVIDIHAHKTQIYNLNPPAISSPEPVTSFSGSGIAADGSQLSFIQSGRQSLMRVDSQNIVTTLGGGQSLQTIRWANPDYGVGQDSQGHLYTINNGSVTLLKVPEAYDASKPVNFSLTPGRQIYLSFGSTIYSGNEGSGFKKIYSSASNAPKLAASDSSLAVLESQDESSEDQSLPTQTVNKNHKSSVAVIDKNGKLIKKISIRTIFATWSPNSQRLALTTYDSSSYIYDNSLNQLATIPNHNTANLKWLNNDVILYSVDNKLWTYSLQKGQAVAVANLSPESTIGEIAVDKDAHFIYLSVIASQGGGIKRVGLSGQKVADFVYQLDVFLPTTKGQCTIDYVNFTRPTISVTTAGSPSAACQNTAKDELRQDGFDLSQLQPL